MSQAVCYLPNETEASEIKAGNRELINRFYLKNYDLIKTVSRAYCRTRRLDGGLWEDMAQSCYLYFPKFKFDKVSHFIRSIRDICVYEYFGGERLFHQFRQGDCEILTILDRPITDSKGNVSTLGDFTPSPFDIDEEIEKDVEYDNEERLSVKLLSLLSPREQEAFKLFYWCSMSAREVGQKMGISRDGAQSLKHSYRERLKANKDLIL